MPINDLNISVASPDVTGWDAALWGLLGGAVAEALNLSASMRPTGPGRRWRWPWRNSSEALMVLVAVALRLFVGCGLAAALGASSQLPTPFAAFLAGLAAPLVVTRLFQTIPVAAAEDSLSLAPPSLEPAPVLPSANNAGHLPAGASHAASEVLGRRTPDAAGE